MKQRLEFAGSYRADVTDYGLFRGKDKGSQAAAIELFCETVEVWDAENETWCEYPDCQTRGRVFIIGRDGAVLQNNVRRLTEATGWDGSLGAIIDRTWEPPRIQITVNEETNDEGRTYHVIGFVDHHDGPPYVPEAGNVPTDKARAIAQRYGRSLAELAGKYVQSFKPPQEISAGSPPPPEGEASSDADEEPLQF